MSTEDTLAQDARAIAEEVSGELALQTIHALFPSDRRGDFAAFSETANLAADLMAGAGLRDVALIPHPADGRTGHGDWIVPQAWDCFGGSLRIAAPARLRRTVVRHPNEPLSIAMWSAPTGPEGVEGELVLWESLTEPRAGQGRIVLTRRKVREIAPEALAAGALGIVSDAPQQPDMPRDARYWENYVFCPRNERGGWAFVLSPQEGEALRADLARCGSEPLRLRAVVNTNLYDGQVQIVTGVVPGSELPEEEVLLLAHLYEIGANDNMSGVAAVIEAARALNTLVASGALAPARRTLRVLLCYEQYGSLAYLDSRRHTVDNIVAGLNADMVGEDQALCGSALRLDRTPAATPSYANDLAAYLLDDLQRHLGPLFRWNEHQFAVHDGFISDPMIGVPTPTFIHQPDRFYHSDADTPDKCSPRTLHAVAAAASCYARTITAADEATACWLASLTSYRAKLRLLREFRRIEESGRVPWGTLQERAGWLYEREALAIRSPRRLVEERAAGERFDEHAKKLVDQLAEFVALGIEALQEMPLAVTTAEDDPEFARQAEDVGPRRLVYGTPTMATLPREVREEFAESAGGSFPYSDTLCCALFWADGKASVAQIRDHLAQEKGQADLGALMRCFAGLAKYGYVELIDTGGGTPGW